MGVYKKRHCGDLVPWGMIIQDLVWEQMLRFNREPMKRSQYRRNTLSLLTAAFFYPPSETT